MHNLGFGAVNDQTQMVLVGIVTAAICGVLIYASFFHLIRRPRRFNFRFTANQSGLIVGLFCFRPYGGKLGPGGERERATVFQFCHLAGTSVARLTFPSCRGGIHGFCRIFEL